MPGIVTHHARMGSRPGWSRQLPAQHWVAGPNGKPKVLIDEIKVIQGGSCRITSPCPPVRAGLYRDGAYCPLAWRPDPARLLAERAEYTAWRLALELLLRNLACRLATVAILPAAAPWYPWGADDCDAHGRPGPAFTPAHVATREQQAIRRRDRARRALAARDADAAARQPGVAILGSSPRTRRGGEPA